LLDVLDSPATDIDIICKSVCMLLTLKINILEFVKEFKYLGSMTNSTQLGDAEAEK